MSFARRKHPERVLPVEITPMIDVVFLLIIFFMTAAQFAQLTKAELDLPQERGEQRDTAEEAGLIINLTRDGTIIVVEREFSLAALERRIQQEMAMARSAGRGPVKLLLRADRDADSARLNEIVRLMQEIGVPATRVATEVP